jgi:hypothetical protein
MYFKNAWHILQDDISFNRWKKENKKIVFSYAFTSAEKEVTADWQIGFYDKYSDKITTFSVMGDNVANMHTDDVFKEPGAKVLEIDITKVKLSLSDILKKAEEFIKKQYPSEFINKKIIILQNLPEVGLVWNITFFTLTFNSLNLKISAENGEVKSHKLTSLMDYKNKQPF